MNMEEKYYQLIPGFQRWIADVMNQYDNIEATNEQLARLIKACPVRITMEGYTIQPNKIQVPSHDGVSEKFEGLDPSIEIILKIN